MLRIVSATLEDKTKRRFSPLHVSTRVAQVDDLAARVGQARGVAAEALQALQARLAGRLWLPPELADAWCGAHRATLAVADELLARLAGTRAGFAALRVDETLPALAPPLPQPQTQP
jgi:MoxR-like ATPase